MEDQSITRVGLDVADDTLRDQLETILGFLDIEVVKEGGAPAVCLGDGANASRLSGDGSVYIGLGRSNDGELACECPLKIGSLLGAFAEASSALASRDVVALEYVGVSEAAVGVRAQIAKAAATDVTVLISGQSGTGKEVVARALHRASARSQGPFVPVNCGAIPADLLESELFGHEKGAFTGAIGQKIGRLELANGGTLFLDEIGDMPLPMQVKVLRALEERCFERVGGTRPQHSNVRIVAATHRDLEAMIRDGQFREDLYFRLNVFPIDLASLAERSEDIPLLLNSLANRVLDEQRVTIQLSVDALDALQAYAWPGNVRELANLLQRLAVQYPNQLVRKSDLPEKYQGREFAGTDLTAAPSTDGKIQLPVNGIDLKNYLADLERNLIEQALSDTNSVVARAADRLHIRRTTLVEKMRKHGITRAEA